MGRELSLACDNCVVGDASAWATEIALGVVVAAALAFACVAVSARRYGARALAARVAAAVLLVGPAGGAVAASWEIESHGALCGSALSASLLRGVPDDSALTLEQAGCKARGSGLVRAGVAAAASATVAAVVLMLASSVPPRRTAYA